MTTVSSSLAAIWIPSTDESSFASSSSKATVRTSAFPHVLMSAPLGGAEAGLEMNALRPPAIAFTTSAW